MGTIAFYKDFDEYVDGVDYVTICGPIFEYDYMPLEEYSDKYVMIVAKTDKGFATLNKLSFRMKIR